MNSKKSENEVSKGDMWNGFEAPVISEVQKPSDSFPTSGYGYGTYDGTMWVNEKGADNTNTQTHPRTLTSPGIDGSHTIYPNLAYKRSDPYSLNNGYEADPYSLNNAYEEPLNVNSLTDDEKDAYMKDLARNMEPVPEQPGDSLA
jgi:hypothetical protein